MRESSGRSDEPVPLREICERHEGEWLLVKILDAAASAGDEPSVLLAHALDRAAMFKVERKVRKQDPGALLTIVGGGTKFGGGEALRASLARTAAEKDWVSVNSW